MDSLIVLIFYAVLITICLGGKAAILVKKIIENQKDNGPNHLVLAMLPISLPLALPPSQQHPLKENNIDLCAIAMDYKVRKGKPGQLSIDDYEKSEIKAIMEILNIPLPKKMIGHLMAQGIYNYVSINCPDQCLDQHNHASPSTHLNANPSTWQPNNNCGINNQRWNLFVCGHSGYLTLILACFSTFITNDILNWLILDQLNFNKEAAAQLNGTFYQFICCNCVPLIGYLINDKLYQHVKTAIF